MEEARPKFCDASRSQGNASPSSRRTSGGPTYSQTLRCTSIGPTSSLSCSMGARHGLSARPWQSASTPSTPGVCGKFYGFRTPCTLQMTQSGVSRAACHLWKGQIIPSEVFRAPGLISCRGGPPPCHRRRTATTTWLAETSWSTKIHLAESDRWWRSAPELWGPRGLEEGKRQGYLVSSHQYGNALLGVHH